MGDKDGARELLSEVMTDGDAAQKGQAQQLLVKLS
jgi:FimV-like protein